MSFRDTIKMGREQSGRMLSGAVKLMIIFTTWDLGYASTNYVWTNSPYEGAPYNAWTNAAHAIQTAVDAAGAGDTILVTNGVYNVGGRITPGYALTNRVCITNFKVLRSVNGPGCTTIQGAPAIGGKFGDCAVRCVYMNNYNSSLIGFTLSGGYTMSNGDANLDRGGGGIYISSGTLSNCVISSNFSHKRGGGIYITGGTLNNCVIIGNEATNNWGGGVACLASETINMNNCTISNNIAFIGGGIYLLGGTTKDCLLSKNTAISSGGGAYFYASGNLINCTVVGNTAQSSGGGVYFYNGSGTGSVNNCVIWGNISGDSTSNIYGTGVVSFTCSGPAQSGTGNIGTDPRFVESLRDNYRLRMSSPCVNAGTNQDWMTNAVDLEGNARILNNIVDMGAYETILWQGTIFRVGL